jgi:putative ABC transport system permease protein
VIERLAPWRVARALSFGTWRDQPARLVLAILGIAFGVALGVAVHLINASAAAEFDLAVRSLSGAAHVVIRGSRSGFPDTLYPAIARAPGVHAASPAIELDAQLAASRDTIRMLGLDPFRAAEVQPHLLADTREGTLDLLKGDAVLLSRAAADALNLSVDGVLRVHAGTGVLALRVVGILPAGATRQRIAIMDIAAAQWRLGRLGELHRIDVKLQPGTNPARFRESISALLPAGVLASTPEIEAERSASFTRAYRINLDMLALVALFTGAFLVFSTQFLALLRRRTQLALFRVLGLTRARLVVLLVLEGAAVGVVGATIGVLLGCVLAQYAVERLGGDLGAGYYRAVTPVLVYSMPALFAYLALGVAFAVAGAALPAYEASRRSPALALKAGDEEAALRHVRSVLPGALLLASGAALSQAPPVYDLPLFGYLAVALVLIGAILVMPRFAEVALGRLPRVRYAPATLAAAQLQATPRQVGVSLAAIVASLSLMVSMLIMIGSFRASLDTWLDAMLPADLYVRAGRAGETGYFSADEQQAIAQVKGVRDAVFVRSQNVLLRADRPAVTLLARPFENGRPRDIEAIDSASVTPGPGALPAAWLSEVASDLIGAKPGDTIELPIGGALRAFRVAALWRDYARQNGAVVINRAVYVAVTGDARASEAALHLEPGARFEEVAQGVRDRFDEPQALEITSTRELKAVSLSIFDRTFAVTYVLEGAAVLIGLFGVSASFSAQALARRREFGVLRHLGMRRRDVGAMLACEGFAVGTLGVVAGLAVGWLVSLILVHVINRQSFHWSMDMHLPWRELVVLSLTLVVAATVTAVLSGRRAMSDDVTRAVREDW